MPVAPLRHELVDVHQLLKEAEGLVTARARARVRLRLRLRLRAMVRVGVRVRVRGRGRVTVRVRARARVRVGVRVGVRASLVKDWLVLVQIDKQRRLEWVKGG